MKPAFEPVFCLRVASWHFPRFPAFKLNARAMEAHMALHDLSEELPAGLEKVMEVAQAAVTAFQNLDEARKKLAAAGS